MKKRILPSILAVALLLSIAVVPTFASAGTTVTGAYEAITIAVDVPSTQSAKVNPYGMPVTLDDAAESTISGQQVTSLPIYVVNKTTVPLYVGATVVTTTKGSFALSKTADLSTLKTKTGYLYLQMATTDLDEDAMKITLKTGNTEIDTYELDKDVFYPVFAAWDQDFDAAKDLVLATGDTGVSKSSMMLLSAAEKVAAEGTSGQAGYKPARTAVTAGGIGMVRIAGSVVEEPNEKWTASDGFTAKITYSFKPDTTSVKLTADKTSINLGGTAGTDDTATVTATLSSGTIKAITWKLLDSDGEEVTPAGVTLTGDTLGTDVNTATAKLKVATGALAGPETYTVQAAVTASNDQTYTFTKDITVEGDTTVTLTSDKGNDIDASDGNVTVLLTAAVLVNGSAPGSETVVWSFVDDGIDGVVFDDGQGSSSGQPGSGLTQNIKVQSNVPDTGAEVTVQAVITAGGKTYTATITLTVTGET